MADDDLKPEDFKEDYINGEISGLALAAKLKMSFSDLVPLLDAWRDEEEGE